MVNWYRDSLLKLTFIGVQLLYNVVLVSTVQQNDLCICIHISLSFWTSLHSGHQCIKQSSLCYTVGSHQLSILCILSAVYMCQCQSPNLSHPTPLPFSIHMFVLYVCVSISSLEIRSLLPVLHLAFKNALWKAFRELRTFQGMSRPSPCTAQQQNFLCSRLLFLFV